MQVRLLVSAWVHKDAEDDFNITTCLGDYEDTDEGYAEAEELVREILKLQNSRDLTDFEIIPIIRDEEMCKVCLIKSICGKE